MFLLEALSISALVWLLNAQQQAQQSQKEASRYQDTLCQSEECLGLLVEGVRDYAICMIDPCGHIISWNTGLARIKGYQANEIIGQHLSLSVSDTEIGLAYNFEIENT